MVNAWSLLYDELNGTMDENFPVKNIELDDNVVISTGSTASMGDFVNFDISDPINNVTIDTSNLDFSINVDDSVVYAGDAIGDSVYADTWPHAETVRLNIPNIQKPGIEKDCNRKYKEDESIKALQDYISTTYGGHYTSDNNNVQTLDLIESVGDAESFCRSNAIKYLSRYDKKGQAKRDILKALHYTLLLYHFSGQLNETPTRGYETF